MITTPRMRRFVLASALVSLALVPISVSGAPAPDFEAPGPLGLRALYRTSPLGMIGALSAGIVNGAFWGMGPVFGQRLSLGDENIALLMSVTILGGVMLLLLVLMFHSAVCIRQIHLCATVLAGGSLVLHLAYNVYHHALTTGNLKISYCGTCQP